MQYSVNNTPAKQWLYEISFIRPILLILLVSYHAFCYNCGAWNVPDGITVNNIYKWIALLSRAFRLEGFVFVSGYVFALQVLKNNKFESIRTLIVSKFKRLIIPYFIFGTLYYFLFTKNSSPLIIVTGIGHLWYLPCLFWCFLATYIIYKSNLKDVTAFIILTLLIPLSVIPIPLQINKALYYMFFFFGGGLFWKYSERIHHYINRKRTMMLWAIFGLMLILLNLTMESLLDLVSNNQIVTKAIVFSINKVIKAILASVGIIAIYFTATQYTNNHRLNSWVVKIGDYGYGVYIFHQFILCYIFYHTTIPSVVGSIWLPWVAFVIATITSVALTYVLRSTRFGRKLI